MEPLTLKELSASTGDYLKRHWDNGGTSEFDTSINDLSRAKIEAMKREYGDCWMFKVNRYEGDKDESFLVQYTGQKVYNFEYSGIIPCYDKTLEDLLKDYAENSGYPDTIRKKIDTIYNRMDELNGINLIWS